MTSVTNGFSELDYLSHLSLEDPDETPSVTTKVQTLAKDTPLAPTSQQPKVKLEGKTNGKKSAENDEKSFVHATNGTSVTPKGKLNIKRVKDVKHAHQDDIHCMIPIGNQFVTGSKDCSLKLWDHQGKLIKTVFDLGRRDYEQWITALTPFGSEHWLSGARSGSLDLWQNDGEVVRNIPACPNFSKEYQCKDRNAMRIHCLSQGKDKDGKPIFFAGWPTQFTVQSSDGKKLGICTTSDNDWVFSVTQLSPTRHLVVTGARLDLYDCNEDYSKWKWSTSLIAEKKRKGRNQRPFISAVTSLANSPHTYSLAIFQGSVKIIDIAAQKIIRDYREHTQGLRVWTTAELPKLGLIASCSDDKTIKIWDVRQTKSVQTLGGNIGRVSTLLTLGDYSMVSGSCPDDLRSTKERACLSFWDLRMT